MQKTFIDDIFLRTKPEKDQKHAPSDTLHVRQSRHLYESKTNTKLKLNPQKSQIMLITEEKDLKKDFKIILNKKRNKTQS